MGHSLTGTLPRSRKWRQVVALLTGGAALGTVAGASAEAAERALAKAPHNPVFVEAVRLLSLIPQAARDPDFGQALRALDLEVGSRPHLIDLIVAVGERLDGVARLNKVRDDFGEIASRALLNTLSLEIERGLPTLLDPTPDEIRREVARAASPSGFSGLARAFFGRLLEDTLRYWLDRTLSAQVGAGRRFPTAGDRRAFDAALANYSVETSRIIQEFAAGWYAKATAEGDLIDTSRAAAFGAIAFKKMRAELIRRRHDDG